MKLIDTIRPTETKTIEVKGDDFEAAKIVLEQQIPAGYQLIAARTDR